MPWYILCRYPYPQWPEDPAQIMILDEDVPLAPLPKTGKGPAVFMITGETRRRGISRHETKIRGIRCNKQTDLELIYEIPDFPVRGNGPSDDFLYCGIRPFIGPSGAGRFHRRGKGWHEDSGRYPADPGGTSGVGGESSGHPVFWIFWESCCRCLRPFCTYLPKLCLWSWCVWYPTQQPQGWCWTYLRSTEQTPRLDLLHPYS